MSIVADYLIAKLREWHLTHSELRDSWTKRKNAYKPVKPVRIRLFAN